MFLFKFNINWYFTWILFLKKKLRSNCRKIPFIVIFQHYAVSKAPNSAEGYSWLSIIISKMVWFLRLTSYKTVYYLKKLHQIYGLHIIRWCLWEDMYILKQITGNKITESQNGLGWKWALGSASSNLWSSSTSGFARSHRHVLFSPLPCLSIRNAFHQRNSGKKHKLHSCFR